MSSFAFFSLIAGLLQLSIPPYALRLLRRFGSQRVGWFLVSAFACLGLLHLLEPFRALKFWPGSAVTLDAMYAVGSLLLLIGMAHVETLVSARLEAAREAKNLRDRWTMQFDEQMAALATANEALTQELARRQQREQVLEESEAHYRFLFIQNPQPMWIFDLRSFRFLAVNQAALGQYRFTEPEFMALGAPGLISPEARAAFLQNVARPCSGVESRGRWRLQKKDGTPIEVEITAVDLKYGDCPARLVLANDLEPTRRREQQLFEVQRTELIGKVAGGIAHHFNNILTVITGHTDILLEGSENEQMNYQLNQVAAATHRGAALTRQLLAAGSQQMITPEPLNLNDCIQRLNLTLRRLLGSSITFQNCFGTGLPPILADARAVETIVVSLALNARDAMSGQGTLTLATKAVRITEAEARRHNHAAAGEFVCLRVADTGCGMTPEVQARLFEPFFSTKEIGKAMGLGLASAFGLARQHSGWIECVSEAGKGTEIQVFFPCLARSSGGVETQARAASPVARETVLLVEADDRARALGRFYLNRQGFSVIEADSASLALSLWQSERARIALVLTEVNLPGDISGLQLAARLQSARPGLKVIFTSGNANGNGQQPVLPDQQTLVVKPYTAEELLKSVEECLAA